MRTASRPFQSAVRFLHEETGAVTIEFTTLVVPFILMMVFFVDASIMYFTHSEMYNVARDIARRMATGEIQNDDEALQYATRHLFLGQRTYTLDSDFRESAVTIAVSVSDAAVFGTWFRPILGRTLIARAAMGPEPLR